MKLFLLNIFLFFGISKIYAGTAEFFVKNVTKLEATDSASSGCRECSGTERPGSNTVITK